MSDKHTPGPWIIQTPFAPDTISIVVGGPEAFDWKFVAEVISENTGISKKQAKANAALIVSSPCLLAALQGLMAFAPAASLTAGVELSAWIAARAAIARATGAAP